MGRWSPLKEPSAHAILGRMKDEARAGLMLAEEEHERWKKTKA